MRQPSHSQIKNKKKRRQTTDRPYKKKFLILATVIAGFISISILFLVYGFVHTDDSHFKERERGIHYSVCGLSFFLLFNDLVAALFFYVV